MVNFGSLPYGARFKYENVEYKKNVYPGATMSDRDFGSALDPNDVIVMFNNIQLVENIHVETD